MKPFRSETLAARAARIGRAVIIGLFVFVFIVAVGSSLTGCAVVQTKINAQVAPIAHADLENAKTIATTYGDSDAPTSLKCFNGLEAYADALPTTANTQPLPSITGVFALAESARIAAQRLTEPQQSPLPRLDKDTEAACLLWLAQNGVERAKLATFVAAVASGAQIAKAGAALKGEAAALQTEAAALKAVHP